MPASFFDDFNRADTADIAGSNGWVFNSAYDSPGVPAAQKIGIAGNQAQITGPAASDRFVNYENTSAGTLTDCYTQIVVGTPVPGTFVYYFPIVRMTPNGVHFNGYQFTVRSDTGALIIQSLKLGVGYATVASGSYGGALPVGAVLKLEAVGSTLNGYIDNVLFLTGTDSQFASGSAGLGLYLSNPGGVPVVDNFEVGEPLLASPISVGVSGCGASFPTSGIRSLGYTS